MNIDDSILYKYLIFLKQVQALYNAKEIFNLILGYQLASNEKWLSNFNYFMERKLLNKYFKGNKLDRLPQNYGQVIYENQKSDSEGLALFFNLLKEYKESVIPAS